MHLLARFLCRLSSDFEASIAALGRDNAQLLFNRIFELPTEPIPHDVGKLALLPTGTTPLPREKSVPKPAAPTKWEAFAKLKGIEKTKRSRMVQDEATGELAPRFGYKSARKQAEDAEWAIEAPKNAETGAVDPWTQQGLDKKARVSKNKKQQDRNVLKSAAKGSKNRMEGAIDLKSAIDLSAAKLGIKQGGSRKKEAASLKKPKHHVDLALGVAQKSTASMGKFDQLRVHEPNIVLPKAASNRAQRHDATERSKSRPEEKSASLAALSKVLTGQKDNDNYGPNQRVNMDKVRSMGQQEQEKKNIDKKRKTASASSFKGGKQNKGGAGGGGGASSKKKDGAGSNKKQRR